MSLITEALELESRRKPRSIQVSDLPPFSKRPWILKTTLWVVGIGAAVALGVLQGNAAWEFVQKTTGFQGDWVNLSAPLNKIDGNESVGASETRESVAISKPEVGLKSRSQKVAEEIGIRSDVMPAGVPAPVLVALQTPEADESLEVEKKKYRLELAVRNLAVQGVRMQGEDSRALIQGEPVGIGEPVGSEGLKLKAIEASRLIFGDSLGREYYKSY